MGNCPIERCCREDFPDSGDMIKRILVALDVDTDTPAAIQYAENIAKRYDAEVVGLAVVDTGNIDSGARGGGIGSMYYAEKLRENLTEETREKARALIQKFEAAFDQRGLDHSETVKEGVPFRRIVEDMKYHDLLVVGREPHFFYGHPEQKTKTLGRVVKETTAPTVVVGNQFTSVRRVLIAFDGSSASARTAQYYLHLLPFGKEVGVEAIHVHQGNDRESELLLAMFEKYCSRHAIELRTTSMRGEDPGAAISNHAQETDADIVVAGAHSVSKIKEWTIGSTTSKLLETCPTPMFLYH